MDKNIKKEKAVSEQRHPEQDLVSLAEEAFIYGYPMVYNLDMIRSGVKGLNKTLGGPLNVFQHNLKLANYNDKFVSVNNDTVYSVLLADVSLEPLVLQIPDTGDRYNVIQFIDAWTNNFAYLGTRSTDNKKGLYLLTGPDWNDELPQEVKQIKVPTNTFVILGRFEVQDEEDLENIKKLQEDLWVTPLSFFPKVADQSSLKQEELSLPQYDTNVNRQIEFWEALRVLMKYYPPTSKDKGILNRFKPLGILDNKNDTNSPYRNIDNDLLTALQEGAKKGKVVIDRFIKEGGKAINGWILDPHIFDYNLDFFEIGTIDSSEWKFKTREEAYMHRAAAARAGLWGNNGYEAVYAQCYIDDKGEQLNGKNKYKIHFDKVPPAKAFWSITMYNMPNFYLCENEIERYSIGDRTKGLKYNKDGSLDIYIQKENPGKDKEANWLPAPEGDFRPLMRIYLPEEEVLNGKFELPAINKVY